MGGKRLRQMSLGTRLLTYNAAIEYVSTIGYLCPYRNLGRQSQYRIAASIFSSTLVASARRRSSALDRGIM